jgi:hypothetical protein
MSYFLKVTEPENGSDTPADFPLAGCLAKERFYNGSEVVANSHHRESLGILYAPWGARADSLLETTL